MLKRTVILIIIATFVAIIGDSTAPAFTIETIQNETLRSEALLEKGPIFIEFWATWCNPCVRFLPHVDQFSRNHPEMTFIAVSIDRPRDRDKVLRHARSNRFNFVTGFDGSRDLQRLFNVTSVPRTIMINQAGEIVYDNSGYNSGDEVGLEAKIKEILGK